MITDSVNFIVKKLLPSLIMAAAVILSYFLWKDGCFLPRWIRWDEKTVTDMSGEYTIILKKRTARILYKDSEIWVSPDNIEVQDMSVSDVDNDGADELSILCWKVGRYGDAKPFWVKAEETEDGKWSQHLFVYEFRDDKVKPKWMSSYLGVEVHNLLEDEKNEKNLLLFTDRDGHISAWRWDSWGFSRAY